MSGLIEDKVAKPVTRVEPGWSGQPSVSKQNENRVMYNVALSNSGSSDALRGGGRQAFKEINNQQPERRHTTTTTTILAFACHSFKATGRRSPESDSSIISFYKPFI